MKLVYLTIVLSLGAGCTVTPTRTFVAQAPAPSPQVRSMPFVKAYSVGPYIDPNNPKVMHQAHTLFVPQCEFVWVPFPWIGLHRMPMQPGPAAWDGRAVGLGLVKAEFCEAKP